MVGTGLSSANASELPRNPLGTSGIEITRVGLGSMAIGGANWTRGWGAQDDADSIAAIHRAVERGINWIDTAAVYGFGHSEAVVGRAIASLPADMRPLIFTKGGQPWDPANPSKRLRIGRADSLRAECEASLRRLGVEAIDLYQMHWPAEDGTPLEDYWQTLLDLKAEGKVRAVGLSNHDAEQLARAEALGHVDSLQPGLSILNRRALSGEIPWCAAHGTGVIVYGPLQRGLLSGTFSKARAAALPADDWRAASPDFRGEALDCALAIAGALRPIAEKHGVSIAAVAIAWTLTPAGVSGAIVGARNAAQVDNWIAAATLVLDRDDLNSIESAIEAVSAG